MKRDLSKPLAPTFGEKPKKKIKTVKHKWGNTITTVTKNKKDRYGKSKVEKRIARDASGEVFLKIKKKKTAKISKIKSKAKFESGTKVKKKRKLTKDFQTKTTTVIKKPGTKRVKTVSYKKV